MAFSAPPIEASTNSLTNQFLRAVTNLSDLATIHTSSVVNNLRTEVIKHEYSDSAVADDIVRTLEVWGIAKAVLSLFPHAPNSYSAVDAFYGVVYFARTTIKQFKKRDLVCGPGTDASAPGTDKDAFRALLRTHLGWVHEYGTLADGAPDAAVACLCPATAYLQLIVHETPTEHWTAALLPTTKPEASPLAFALALARRSPGAGQQTADVALLVAMGRSVVVRMRKEREKKAMEREEVAQPSMVRQWFSGLAGFVYAAPTNSQNHQSEPDSGGELLQTISNLAEILQQEGDRYARLLGKQDGTSERATIADSIRRRVHTILVSTDLSVPSALIETVDGLAIGGE